MSSSLSSEARKALGAFYTGEPIVRFLVRWALGGPVRSVMDPSCGDGRFLRIAGESGARRLVGCDLDAAALTTARASLDSAGFDAELISSDFFSLDPESVAPVDAVVGNPPFIRYQRFSGETRANALRSALRVGVKLTQLTSSWAPFLLHSVQFLGLEGQLAMVVPAEITQTQYGLATLRALLGRFASVELLTFDRNAFADAQADTCLLLASGHGGRCFEVRLVPLESAADLESLPGKPHKDAVQVEVPGRGVVRFAEAFLTAAERRVWRRLRKHPDMRTVGSLGTLANGYVSGDNDFFHRNRAEARKAGIPASWLRPAARGSRQIEGLFFGRADVRRLERSGHANHLLVPREDLFSSHRDVLSRLIEEAEARGTPQRFKCRTREPWWQVPGLLEADVLLGYMSGQQPKAAVNSAHALYPNSLHGLRLVEGIRPEPVALSFHSSLSRLSLEIEGRSYGGGILKLEPTEMQRVALAWPELPAAELESLAAEVDALLRSRSFDAAVERVDAVLLQRGLGISKRNLKLLRAARERLMRRRISKNRKDPRGPQG